jgi:hypothetical protein
MERYDVHGRAVESGVYFFGPREHEQPLEPNFLALFLILLPVWIQRGTASMTRLP